MAAEMLAVADGFMRIALVFMTAATGMITWYCVRRFRRG